jgi:hypothetical protein
MWSVGSEYPRPGLAEAGGGRLELLQVQPLVFGLACSGPMWSVGSEHPRPGLAEAGGGRLELLQVQPPVSGLG